MNEFTFMELKHELKEILNIEEIRPEHFQDEIIRPLFNKFYKKSKSEKPSTDAHLIPLTNYARSPFRDFES